MNDTFFTSDTHFFHKNILKFCPDTRIGADHLEMTELMVEAWNGRVKPDDTVYHLGDVSFGKADETLEVLNRLNGKIHLIEGNHDKGVTQGPARQRWASVKNYDSVKVGGETIIMFHYPIKEWQNAHRGAIHLYGHVHGKDMGLSDYKAMDVGVDTRPNADMAPWSFDEIMAIMSTRKILTHHG